MNLVKYCSPRLCIVSEVRALRTTADCRTATILAQYYTERRIVRDVELELGEKLYHVKISLIARGKAVIRRGGKAAHLNE